MTLYFMDKRKKMEKPFIQNKPSRVDSNKIQKI